MHTNIAIQGRGKNTGAPLVFCKCYNNHGTLYFLQHTRTPISFNRKEVSSNRFYSEMTK